MNLPSLTPDSPEFAPQLMNRVAAAYASCHSYMDEGEVTEVFLHMDGSKRWTSRTPFSTAFVRPSDFRFEFRYQHPRASKWNRYVVWQGSKSVLKWWSSKPGVETRPSLSLAIAGATGVSGGSAITVPNLLMPQTITCMGILAMTEWQLLGEETVEGAAAYKVHGIGPPYQGRDGQFHQRQITLWIETQTLLLLQTFDAHDFEDFRTETTTIYLPQINISVPPEKLHFDAPV